MREVTYFVLTLEQVKAFVAGVQPKWQAAPRIAIVARRELDLSTAKIIKSYMPELSIRIFTDYDEALLWLTEPAA